MVASNLDKVVKVLETAIGTALMTEEGISRIFSELKLPRDATKYIKDQTRQRKEDLGNLIRKELQRFLSRINLHEEIQKAISGMTIHIDATVKLSKQGRNVRVTQSRVKTHARSSKK